MGPYLDGLSLSMHQGRSREYISAVVCAWIGAFVPSLCVGMAVIWLYCALVAAPVRETFLITGMYGLIAVLFVGLPMVYQVRKIAERVIVPWLARSRPGSGSGDEPGDAFRGNEDPVLSMASNWDVPGALYPVRRGDGGAVAGLSPGLNPGV